MGKAATVIDDDHFITAFKAENGSCRRMAKILHTDERKVRARVKAMGLTKPKYLSACAAAESLGISRVMVIRLIGRGELPAVKRDSDPGHPKRYGNMAQWLITPGAIEEIRPRIPELLRRSYLTQTHQLAPDGFLTTRETAKLLGVQANTVVVMCERGQIEAQHFGRQWIIPKSQPRIAVALARAPRFLFASR